MKELYVGSKCTKLVATILFMNLCMVHGVNNRFLWHHLFLKPDCLPTNYYAVKVDTKVQIKL